MGGMYTNTFTHHAFYTNGEWDKLAQKFPNFDAYGKRFAAANQKWLDARP